MLSSSGPAASHLHARVHTCMCELGVLLCIETMEESRVPSISIATEAQSIRLLAIDRPHRSLFPLWLAPCCPPTLLASRVSFAFIYLYLRIVILLSRDEIVESIWLNSIISAGDNCSFPLFVR